MIANPSASNGDGKMKRLEMIDRSASSRNVHLTIGSYFSTTRSCGRQPAQRIEISDLMKTGQFRFQPFRILFMCVFAIPTRTGFAPRIICPRVPCLWHAGSSGRGSAVTAPLVVPAVQKCAYRESA